MIKASQAALRPCTIIWVVLLLLTFATYVAAQLGLQGKGLILGVLILALFKGQMIADAFMGLRQVRGFWRPVVSSYFIIIGALIAGAFLLPQG